VTGYGGGTPDTNTVVKVFVPRNNWSQAFFIVGSTAGSSTTDYNSLSNQPQINAVTLSGNKTSSELNLYGTGNPPPYPVTSVNTKTGAVLLTTDNVPATTTNRYVPAAPNTNPNTTFLNGNGVFTTIAAGGATSIGNIYLSNTASTVSGYKTLNYIADTTATEMSVTCTSTADVLSATYLYTSPLDTNVIDAGIWKSTFYMKCSANAGTNRLKIVCFVRHTNGTETDLFTTYTASVAQTTYDYFYTESSRQQFSVLPTDTLGFRIYGNTNRTSSTIIYYQIGSTNASYFNSPLSLRHTQLRELNGDPSYQHVTTAQVAQIGAAYSPSNPPPYPVTSVNGNTGAVMLSIPTKTSDLTNDSNYLPVVQTSPTNGQIVSYNGTNWVNADPQASAQLQANWSETNTSSVQYIQNKPNLSIYAPLASPALTGIPTAPTAALRTNSTQLATTAFVLANSTEIITSSAQPSSQISGDFWYKIL
jgi:hypothetical protein